MIGGFNSLQTGTTSSTNLHLMTLYLMMLRFNSLQTGTTSSTQRIKSGTDVTEKMSFNSLQTGRSFPTYINGNNIEGNVYKFQFPSNGMVFQNMSSWPKDIRNLLQFRFPSNGNGFQNFTAQSTDRLDSGCFNSLQTGRAFRTWKNRNVSDGIRHNGFNSLQTGRAFRTKMHKKIPERRCAFQFPSNGKVFPNRFQVYLRSRPLR